MTYPPCPPHLLSKLPFPSNLSVGPCLNVLLSEEEVCGHQILMTWIDEEFVGIRIEKGGKEVFSHLMDTGSTQSSRKGQ